MGTYVITETKLKKLLDNLVNEQLRISGGFSREASDFDQNIATQWPGYKSFIAGKTPESLCKMYGFEYDASKQAPAMSGEFAQNVSEMKRMMDPDSIKVFDMIPSKNMMFYIYAVGKFSQNKNSKGRRKKIVVDNYQTVKQEPVVTPKGDTPPKEEPGYELNSGGQEQPVQYVINEAILTEEFKNYIIQNVINPIKENIQHVSQKGNKVNGVYVDKLIVSSSCSTAPNKQSKVTFPGKVPTFQELSQARGNVVYQFITEQLSSLGVPVKYGQDKSKVGVNSQGTNGDGTSGPAWAAGMNWRDVQQYQRADVNITYAVSSETPGQKGTPDKGDVVIYVPKTEDDFTIRFTAKGRLKFNLDWSYTPKTRIPNARKRLKCPRF
jgi:hypothetical protein